MSIAVFQQFVGQKFEGLDVSLGRNDYWIKGHSWSKSGRLMYQTKDNSESIVVRLDKASSPDGIIHELTVLEVYRPSQEEINLLKR